MPANFEYGTASTTLMQCKQTSKAKHLHFDRIAIEYSSVGSQYENIGLLYGLVFKHLSKPSLAQFSDAYSTIKIRYEYSDVDDFLYTLRFVGIPCVLRFVLLYKQVSVVHNEMNSHKLLKIVSATQQWAM